MKRIHLISAIFLLIVHCVYFYGWTMDDPYISYRYAQNVVEGKGFVFNEGERVEGYSNFLFVLILATAYKLGIDLIIFSRLIGLIFSILILLLIYLMLARESKDDKSTNLLSCLSLYLLALSAPFAMWAVGGLETSLFALLLLLAVITFIKHEESPNKKSLYPILTGLFLILLSLTRPEGFIIFGAFVLYKIIMLIFYKDKLNKFDFLWSGIFLIGFIIYNFWRIKYFGQILPNTFYAKATGALAQQLQNGIIYSINFLSQNGSVLFFLIIVPFIFKNRFQKRHGIILTTIFSYLFFIIYCGGDWMPIYRFFVPIIPLLMIMINEGLIIIFEKLKLNDIDFKKRDFAALIVVLVLVTNLYFERKETLPIMYAVRTGTLTGQYEEVAKWMKTNLPADSVFAGAEAGIIPYYSGFKFIDIIGLVDAHVAHQPGQMHEKTDVDYVLGRQPDFILLHTHLQLDESGYPLMGYYPFDNKFLQNPQFKLNYRILNKFIRGNEKYGQNYFVLFER